jgi:hypothetical protein
MESRFQNACYGLNDQIRGDLQQGVMQTSWEILVDERNKAPQRAHKQSTALSTECDTGFCPHGKEAIWELRARPSAFGRSFLTPEARDNRETEND